MRILLLTILLIVPSAFANDIPDRADVARDLKWDLTAMYPSWEAWESDFKKAEAMVPRLRAFRGKLGKDPETLQIALETSDEADIILGNVYVFAGLNSFEDLRNSDNSARFSQARSLIARVNEATAFYRPELLAVPVDKLKRMIDSTPDLRIRQHEIDQLLRQKKYTLSEREEELLSAATDPLGKFNNVFTSLVNADLKFGQIRNEKGELIELTKGRYSTLIFSTNRQVREDAWKGLFSEYEKFGSTIAANYEGHVKSRAFLAKARSYDSRLHAATFSSAIPETVYTNLIATTREGAAPLQRYLNLKRHHLGLDELEVWDLYAPLVEPTMKNISWQDAKRIVAEGLAPLGREYLDIYWMGFGEGWVDAVENRGKRGGAYSWGTFTSKPYFSMNFDGTVNSLGTLAHEYGHSIHSYLRNENQPYIYSGSRTFIAEVASMTNEALLYAELLNEASSTEERIFLLQKYLDDFRGSFFRQVSFADFEMQAHARVEAGDALTKDSLNQLYAEIFDAYYGNAVKVHSLNASEWSRIPHFFRNDNFYVYQYATSYAAATALAKQIREEGEPAKERFLTLLKSGDSDYPIELLKQAGVDMSTPQPILDTISEFSHLVDQLEAAINNSTWNNPT
ncbi:MAG: oligoendopeptidase F [Gammaproteobacteria bacterium]|jgi:oligoendopeptidase F|nr:oligoendopeptidase F [Gammaproteobacteria bacterium]